MQRGARGILTLCVALGLPLHVNAQEDSGRERLERMHRIEAEQRALNAVRDAEERIVRFNERFEACSFGPDHGYSVADWGRVSRRERFVWKPERQSDREPTKYVATEVIGGKRIWRLLQEEEHAEDVRVGELALVCTPPRKTRQPHHEVPADWGWATDFDEASFAAIAEPPRLPERDGRQAIFLSGSDPQDLGRRGVWPVAEDTLVMVRAGARRKLENGDYEIHSGSRHQWELHLAAGAKNAQLLETDYPLWVRVESARRDEARQMTVATASELMLGIVEPPRQRPEASPLITRTLEPTRWRSGNSGGSSVSDDVPCAYSSNLRKPRFFMIESSLHGDWGKVTATTEPEKDLHVLTVEGQRRRYEVQWRRRGEAAPKVGEGVLVCSNLRRQLVGESTTQVVDEDTQLVPASSPPLQLQEKKYAPITVGPAFFRLPPKQAWPLAADATVLTRARLGKKQGAGWEMNDGEWLLETGDDTPGASELRNGASVWVLVGKPREVQGRRVFPAREIHLRLIPSPKLTTENTP